MTPERGLSPGSVWLDAQGTQNPFHGERGIARYVAAHTKALVALAPEALGAICLDPELPLPPSLEGLEAFPAVRWRPGRAPRIDERPGIYHVMSPFELAIRSERMWPSVARRGGVRTAVTLYDLIPLVFREQYLDPNPFTVAEYMARVGLAQHADHLFTISQWTADDAMRHLGVPEDRITVIDCGVSPALPALVPDQAEAESILTASFSHVRDGFLLYVGGDDWRKNLDGLLQAYALLPVEVRRSHQLVVVCSLRPHRITELAERARELGIDPADVVFTGYVPDRELVALYRCCGLFVFPSLYEGAGLPVLEAMSCDAPVAASRAASIPEILGDLEATFDAADPADICRCLQGVLATPERLEELRGRSRERASIFTWERVARLTLEGYERALERPARKSSPRRKRLAIMTPWPPQASGVANHSRNLIEELSRRVEVDVIAPRENGLEFDRSLDWRVRLWSDLEFESAAAIRDYDRLLYVLGNSRFHTQILRAFLELPGTALVHDVRLIGLYSHLSWEYPDPFWLQRKVVDLYGDRVPPRQLRRVWDEDVFTEHQIFMTQEVQAHAEEILLHSNFQANVLRSEYESDDLRMAVVPHGIPSPPQVAPSTLYGEEGPLIVTYGIVSVPIKRLDAVLEAFAGMRHSHPRARLVMVGQVARGDDQVVRRLSSRFGISDAVHLHGRADFEDYWGILKAADLAVQLRTGAQGGEASGAVCDCIATRIPTIVSDLGWFAELPDDVVQPVPELCTADELATEMKSMLEDDERRASIRTAQDRYAEDTSFARVAERYVELLEL